MFKRVILREDYIYDDLLSAFKPIILENEALNLIFSVKGKGALCIIENPNKRNPNVGTLYFGMELEPTVPLEILISSFLHSHGLMFLAQGKKISVTLSFIPAKAPEHVHVKPALPVELNTVITKQGANFVELKEGYRDGN